MSCSSTVCSHLSIPSCSSSSSSSSAKSYKDVKTMFIDRDHQKRLNIWTVAYSPSSQLNNNSSLFIDEPSLNQQRNHCFVKNHKVAENGNADETGFSIEKKKIFLYTFPFLFIGVFVAVYYIFHLHRDYFFTNFDPYDVNSGNRESQRPVKSILDHRKRTRTEIQEERIEEIPDFIIGDPKVIEAQFRITNQIYNRNLKDKTSDAFQRVAQRINQQIKLLINHSEKLKPFQLDKVDIISLRKGDNLVYNLNGIIVDLVLHFKQDVTCSLNKFVLNFMSAKENLFLPFDLEIDDRTLKFNFKGQLEDSDNLFNLDFNNNKRYVWSNWSDWEPFCYGGRECAEERVHSRTRDCWDQLFNKKASDLNCINESETQHQSLQIEDCVCEKERENGNEKEKEKEIEKDKDKNDKDKDKGKDKDKEMEKEKEEKCLSEEWRCLDSLCIPLSKRCDGHFNCFDESDEYDCECNEDQGEFHCGSNTSCITIDKKCNNIPDCWDGSDEQGCPGYHPAADYNYY